SVDGAHAAPLKPHNADHHPSPAASQNDRPTRVTNATPQQKRATITATCAISMRPIRLLIF
ncbi:MAG: hypothetical protein WA089_10875, partial [Anaerolineae bacterium]